MHSILSFVFALVISLCPCFAVEVSNACYAPPGLPCASHYLSCSSGRIALQEAFYLQMVNTTCPVEGVNNCKNIDVSSKPITGTKNDFRDQELESLYANCSTRSSCSLPPLRDHQTGFSTISYQCINEIIDMCNVTNIQRNDTSLIWREPRDQKNCVCLISKYTTGKPTLLTLTALELRHHCPELTIVGVTVPNYCSPFTSNRVIVNTTEWKDLMMVINTTTSSNKAIFWVRIQGTEPLNVVCNDIPKETSLPESNTGKVVGIVIPLCIIVAGVVIGVVIFQRRKVLQNGENRCVTKPKSEQQKVHSLEKKSSPDYDYATTTGYLDLVPKTHTMPAPVKGSSGNDSAKCDDQKANHEHNSLRNTQTRESDYDHIGRHQAKANGHYDTTLSVAGTLKGGYVNQEVYSYNHLNEKAPSNVDADSTYNTTASTRHKMDASSNDMEDDYGYNHLGTESKKNLPPNDYDTTASAIRDLARMNGDMEDSTYDHAHLLTSDTSPSGMTNAGFQESDYGHASLSSTAHKDEYESNASRNRSHQDEGVADVYTLAGEAEPNPYQLAK